MRPPRPDQNGGNAMPVYIGKRLLVAIPTLLIISISFFPAETPAGRSHPRDGWRRARPRHDRIPAGKISPQRPRADAISQLARRRGDG
ncbi:hypothetical protein AGR2A_Lc30098 [Agrobacterium genomosp. 2 str. CFBP 5494]|uniref:Uncharacterized protein n=1 Tax=Agrobacterium genomosp. 2 str. CFBP 5494 TaxID=1183436 RepID=A0A9W5B4K4_9HYPH|nr:hypothetical protein AGR2A_Lc30098 [Agrobacterium genomosp. 2 str. CFBP 5494]